VSLKLFLMGTGQVIQRILNDVLSLSKIEEDRLQLDFAPFSIENMIIHTLLSCRPTILDKDLTMVAELTSINAWYRGQIKHTRFRLCASDDGLSHACVIEAEDGATTTSSSSSSASSLLSNSGQSDQSMNTQAKPVAVQQHCVLASRSPTGSLPLSHAHVTSHVCPRARKHSRNRSNDATRDATLLQGSQRNISCVGDEYRLRQVLSVCSLVAVSDLHFIVS